MNTTEMFIIKTVYLGNTIHLKSLFLRAKSAYNGCFVVFILCAPVVLINYRYKIKIDALVHDIIVELQAKVCINATCDVGTPSLIVRRTCIERVPYQIPPHLLLCRCFCHTH